MTQKYHKIVCGQVPHRTPLGWLTTLPIPHSPLASHSRRLSFSEIFRLTALLKLAVTGCVCLSADCASFVFAKQERD